MLNDSDQFSADELLRINAGCGIQDDSESDGLSQVSFDVYEFINQQGDSDIDNNLENLSFNDDNDCGLCSIC